MRKLLLTIFCLLIFPGCARGRGIYPKRPKDTPYFYNETSITEMTQNARIDMRRAREETDIEFVTVLLKTIPGNVPIGKYAAGLFHQWKIGIRTNGKGVLLLFVEDTHTLKIEVSYELEGIFTDAFCSSFQPTIKSYFAGRYFGDVFSNLVGCMKRRVLVGPEAPFQSMLKTPITDPELLKSSETFLSGGGGIIDNEYFYEKDMKLSFIRDIPYNKVREFDSDRNIDVVINRYFKSLEEGINYPFLGILTEGSQMKRLEYPESDQFYKSRWEDCRQALPYKIVYKDNLAALRFRKDHSFPIFLRQDGEGFWRVDAARAWVSSWQDFSTNRSGPLHKEHPWMFAFPEYEYEKSLCNVPRLLPSTVSLREEISRLENAIKNEPQNASNYFKLADIFYWDCMWIGAAIDLVEKGLKLEPDNVPYLWLVILMRNRFPAPEPNARHLEKLLEINPYDSNALSEYSIHCWHYTMEHKKAVRILRRINNAEKRKRLLNSYKWNFLRQVSIDRSLSWKLWNYFRIFYVNSKNLCIGSVAILLILILVFRKKFYSTLKRILLKLREHHDPFTSSDEKTQIQR